MAQDTLLIGKQKTLRFRSVLEQGDKYFFEVPDPPVKGVEIIGQPVIDTLSVKNGKIEIESRVTLTSFDSGSYVLPKFRALRVKSDGTSDTLWFDEVRLEYTTVQIDTATYRPYDVKEQMNYPITVKEILPWAGIVLAAMLGIYLIYKAIKNRMENKDLFGRAIVTDPPHIVALRELERIRTSKIWLVNQKQFFTNLTDTLRVYIEERFKIQAMEQTTGEILKELSKTGMDRDVFNELSELLNLSDLVKFAKYTAAEKECESSVPSAVRFVNATFLSEIEEEKKETNV